MYGTVVDNVMCTMMCPCDDAYKAEWAEDKVNTTYLAEFNR